MFNVILGAQVGRARPKIYSILIYEPWLADCNRLLERSKNYFVVTHSNLKASFKKKPRTTIKQSKTKAMPYIWFWVHWLAEHAPKFVQYQFNKLGLLTTRDPQEGEKIIWKFVFLSRKQVITKKTNNTMKKRKRAKTSYVWFWVHRLAEHAPRSVQYQFTNLGRLTATDPWKGAKIILKLLILTRRPALRKNHGGPSNRVKPRQCLIFDSGCTGSQSMPQNVFNINLPNLVGSLQVTLRKEQKLFGSLFFYLDSKLPEKTNNTMKSGKRAKKSYMWYWVHWFAEHAPKICSISFY